MIRHIEISNFKCFASLRLEFGALTLMTGINAGGKSSAIQPLLLLAQSLRATDEGKVLSLNGPLVRLGTVGDVIPNFVDSKSVKFIVGGTDGEVEWAASAGASERILNVGKSMFKPFDGSEVRAARMNDLAWHSLKELSYIGNFRGDVADSFPMWDSDSTRSVDVGTAGQFAPYWYVQHADDEIPEIRRHHGEDAGSLRKQVDAWMSSLFPHAQANVQTIPQLQLESLQFRSSEIGEWRRPANIGYGFSYAFPIIVALLIAPIGQLLIIDSPEAHLHPLAQSRLGQMLAQLSGAGVNVIVETHSDHLLNGARLGIKRGVLSSEKIRVHFFAGTQANRHGVQTLRVDSKGGISDWPEGFFDQAEKDLAQISGWSD